MKKLNRKVFLSIFLIISFFLIFIIAIYNVQNYKKEYENVYRNLNFMENFNPIKNRANLPKRNNTISRPLETDLDSLMIVDYEVYTVRLKDNKIDRIIGHGDSSSDFDVGSIANSIIASGDKLKIGNLFSSKYAYNYISKSTIIIINTESINSKLRITLIRTLVFLFMAEIIIYLLSMYMTKWITKPAVDAFNKQKDFIADASHELKTPLAVIMASSDELHSDKKNSKYVENIKYESDRMNKLITSLLDLSKLENNLVIGNHKEENLSKIVEKICSTFEGISFENNLLIETKIDKDIMFKCSKDEMEKLFSIILDNAIKHSYSDTTISVNLTKEKNNIVIYITNHGDPINPGDEEKIFERFYRADKSRKRDTNRYGLGLAIAKTIVTNHNGSIKAFSSDGKTTFKIIFKI